MTDLAPSAFDRFLRDRLHGARLVGEIDPTGPLFERAREIAESCADVTCLVRLAATEPATFVVYMVGSGAPLDEERGYWARIPAARGPFASHDIALAFHKAIERLGLASFHDMVESEHAHRHVAQILLHGTVPRRGVAQLAAALRRSYDSGARDIREILSMWRQPGGELERLLRPTRRFIVYGGPFAIDFLSRLLDVIVGWRAPEQSGLPEFVLEALAESRSLPQAVIRADRAQAPIVLQFDPWAGTGPELLLPPTLAVNEWVIVIDGEQIRRTAQDWEQNVALSPFGLTRVEGRAGGQPVARRTFTGVAGELVYLFDDADRLRADQDELSPGPQLVLLPSEWTARDGDGAELPLVEQFGDLFDSWTGFNARTYEVRESDSEVVFTNGNAAEQSVRIPVGSKAARVELLGQPVEGVHSPDGIPVYDALPGLLLPEQVPKSAWMIELDLDSAPSQRIAGDHLESTTLGWRIPATVDQAAALTLSVRGPLGSDLTEQLVVVPGLAVTQPPRIAGPNEVVDVAIHADSSVTLSPPGPLRFDAGVDVHPLQASTNPRHPVQLAIGIPRLLWSIRNSADDHGRVSNRIAVLDPATVTSQRTVISVAAPRVGVLRLELRDEQGQLSQMLSRPPRARATGRWDFLLTPMNDTIRQAEGARLDLVIVADDLETTIARLYRRPELGELSGDLSIADGQPVLDLVWETTGPDHMGEIRLWSEDEPWLEPVIVPLESVADGFVRVPIGSLNPGRYLSEVALADESEQPPAPGERAGFEFRVPGNPGDRASVSALDDLLLGRIPPDAVTSHQRQQMEGPAIDVMMRFAQRNERSLRGPSDRAQEFLFYDPDRLAELVVDETIRRRLAPRTRLHLGIELSRSAVDISPEQITEQQRNDLWETSRILAAAWDRPYGSQAVAYRWAHHTGWNPLDRPLPTPGSHHKPHTFERSADELARGIRSATSRGALLLTLNGFHRASFQWMRETIDCRELMSDWRGANRRGFAMRQMDLPASALQALQDLKPPHSTDVARFGHDITTAAFQFVFPGGDEDAARLALLQAADFATELVTRQLVVAITHLHHND